MAAGMTAGKKKRLQVVADKCGVIAALAIDQRSALPKLFGKAMQVSAEHVRAPFSGVPCGRATWKDDVEILVQNGPNAFEDWLHSVGAENIKRVKARLNAAKPRDLVIAECQPGRRPLQESEGNP
jgi:tagatose-1,6-bisphosphate aldolase